MTGDKLTSEEVGRRAQELARRLMSRPPEPRVKSKPAKSGRGGVSKPEKRAPTDKAS